MKPEQALKRYVKDLLNLEKILWFPMNSGKFQIGNYWVEGCPEGTADLLMFLGDKPVWLELKSPTGKQSQLQKEFQAKVEKLGHSYQLIRKPEELYEWLRGIKPRQR